MAATAADAQILGSSLDSGSFEIGYIYKWYRRDLEPVVPAENNWEVASFFIRYGAFDRLVFSLEGGIWDVTHDDFPDQYFRRYTVGAGVSIMLMSFRDIKVSCSVHFSEVLDHDRSEVHFHKWIRNITAGLFIERSLEVENQSIEMWGGLLYSTDKGETYAWGVPPPVKGESENNVGFGVGMSVLLFDHFAPFAHVVYVEYAQARLGLSLRLQ